jgi:hypothetical protein
MKITLRNSGSGPFWYDESGKTILHKDRTDGGALYIVGKDNLREPNSWWFYQDKYRNNNKLHYGNISFTSNYLRITIK